MTVEQLIRMQETGWGGASLKLTIDPERLQRIREERRPGSTYASLEQCKADTRQALGMFKRMRLPVLNTTSQSIEEISTHILKAVKSKLD
jgi:hypothetical protein